MGLLADISWMWVDFFCGAIPKVKISLLQKPHPKNGLYLVGSTLSGFGADASDIDMCLVTNKTMQFDPREEALNYLAYLESHIKSESGECFFCSNPFC